MPDSITPRITRTNSVMPSSSGTGDGSTLGPVYKGDTIVLPAPHQAGSAGRNVAKSVPPGYEYVGRAPNGGIIAKRVTSSASTDYRTMGPTTAESARYMSDKAKAKAAQDAKDKSNRFDYNKQVQASLANRVSVDGAWVDPARPTTTGGGVTAGLTVNDDGTVTDADGKDRSASYAGRVAKQQQAAAATFGALNLSDIPNGSAQFVLSNGAPIDATTSAEKTDNRQDLVMGPRGLPQNQPKAAPTQNMMTLTGGLQWFKTLAVKDKGAYNALVVQLRNAGYGSLPDDDSKLPLNGYTKQAGEAFVRAASDLADNVDVGEKAPLLDWLTSRGQGYADALAEDAAAKAKAAEYKPVDRSYEDPAAVAARAKAAAISALGRKLTDEEEARFESSFRGQEDGYYDQIDAAGRSKTAAKVANPDLSGQADAFVGGAQYDTERATQAIGSYAQVFKQMMGVG